MCLRVKGISMRWKSGMEAKAKHILINMIRSGQVHLKRESMQKVWVIQKKGMVINIEVGAQLK
jgi:hypothetical protein